MRNFQDTFETRKRSFISAFSICMTVPIKHVKLIIFENYNECKTNHLFLIKKVVTRSDKNATVTDMYPQPKTTKYFSNKKYINFSF